MAAARGPVLSSAKVVVVRFPSPRVALIAAVTATFSLGTVTAVALAGSPEGSVALPRFAPSQPATTVTFPTVDDPGPTIDLPDLGVAAPTTAAPTTRAPAPRRPTTTARPTPDDDTTRDGRPTETTRPAAPTPTRAVPGRGDRSDQIRRACELGYLQGAYCG